MKTLQSFEFKELSPNERIEISAGGILVFAFLAGLAVAYYEKRVKEEE